ncbi:hypothetical protein T10_2381 [Trichinella papuae]|uniref:Uncharacterized protein n=1 Tax=Trichinella papuae TaxID=268474 RepID=A0A0V1M9P8_9BILA|nr:hypothetical protein T10_2381 [Trichinella papuae]
MNATAMSHDTKLFKCLKLINPSTHCIYSQSFVKFSSSYFVNDISMRNAKTFLTFQDMFNVISNAFFCSDQSIANYCQFNGYTEQLRYYS